MKLKHYFLIIGLASSLVTQAGQTIYEYKSEDGSTILSNKLPTNVEPYKKTYYPDSDIHTYLEPTKQDTTKTSPSKRTIVLTEDGELIESKNDVPDRLEQLYKVLEQGSYL